ncbi:hypothetical protein ACWGII_09280 [Streptomyces sp. NPDC054855]
MASLDGKLGRDAPHGFLDRVAQPTTLVAVLATEGKVHWPSSIRLHGWQAM